MKIIVFGLTISSSWGNGHATIWRGLCRSLAKRGHDIVFFERDVPYYARHRDLAELPGMKLKFYSSWEAVMPFARSCLSEADAAFVTSYCPDSLSASNLVLSSKVRRRIFYDLDAPVTLERTERGEEVDYIGPEGLAGFDMVLSYTGGKTLDKLQRTLRAGKTAPLYGSVDPLTHGPVEISCQADLSYLGTYADDRQVMLTRLFIEPARRLPGKRFVIGGSLYPESFPWNHNIYYRRHVAPPQHPEFYCSSRLTLNVTRGAMARMGYCPSGRLFEAAACGVPIVSDWWEGLELFFEPGKEILIARSSEDAVDAVNMSEKDLELIGKAARKRVLSSHTADHRAMELERILEAI